MYEDVPPPPPMYDDFEVDKIKVPPHSIDSERSVLGAVILAGGGGSADFDAWEAVDELVNEHDFYRHDHKLIFRVLAELASKNEPQDAVTVAGALELKGELEEIGGLEFLGDLASGTPTASNVKAYAKEEGTEGLLSDAERKVLAIKDKQMGGEAAGFRDIRSILVKTVERIDELFQSDGTVTGISTCFTDFDDMTSGLQPADLVIVAGRPSMGKTTFSMNIAENVVVTRGDEEQQEPPVDGESEQQKAERIERNRNKGKVAVFSMEMPAEQLAMRMVASLGRVPLQKIRTGELNDQDWPRITSAIQLLDAGNKLFIDDSPGLSPTEVAARARRLKKDHGLELIVLDYLQLMQIKGSSGDNRTAEISEISRSLKSLAKELNVPVIALSQLNRSLEQRTDKRPVMSDLRESGAIEQDADLIVFIYRDEVYNPESPDQGTAEILIRKQRNGPIGTCRVAFQGQFTRFENFAPDHYGGDMGG